MILGKELTGKLLGLDESLFEIKVRGILITYKVIKWRRCEKIGSDIIQI